MIDDECSCHLSTKLNVVHAVVSEDWAEQSHLEKWA